MNIPLFISEIEWNCDLFSSGNIVQSIHTKMKFIGYKEMSQLKDLVCECVVYVHSFHIANRKRITTLPQSWANKNVS